jgi:hypothetical protein
MDLDVRRSLRRLAARTLIVAERCDNRRVQIKLVAMANELIEMMSGRQAPRSESEQQNKPN